MINPFTKYESKKLTDEILVALATDNNQSFYF
jgi:hypothetical protein